MWNLRKITIVLLLTVAVAVGCSSSDQGVIDKAVSATLAAAQPATVAPTATSTPEPVPTDTPAAVAPPPSTPKPTATPEPTQVATATLKSTPAFDEDYIRALNKLMALDDTVVVIPGHGSETTIGHEREHNYFLQGL